ncbi:MAG TPA: response regulator [Actinomycetota bacterium]|nr:response regulator [Actinomycetota bacterium]
MSTPDDAAAPAPEPEASEPAPRTATPDRLPAPAQLRVRERPNPRRFAAMVLVLGLLSSGLLTLLTSDVVHTNERHLLLNDSAIFSSAVGALLGQIQSSLDAAGTVAATSVNKPAALQRADSLPTLAVYTSLVILTPQGGGWTPTVTVHPATISLTDPSVPVARAVQADQGTGIDVVGFIGSGPTRSIAIVDHPVGIPQYLIYAQIPLAATLSTPASSTVALRSIDFALYVGDSEQPADLASANTTKLPLTGTRAVVRLTAGSASSPRLSSRPGDTTGPPQDLLMVFSATGSLEGSLATDLPWIVLAVGVALSVLASVAFSALLASRNQALSLVTEMQESAASRDRALAERSEAEGHRIRLEAQLRQAQRLEAVGQLAGGIAHDFNNLLAVILNFGHFVLEAVKGSPAEDDVQELLRAARQAADLTHQLLIFSRKEVVRPEAVDLNAIIDSTSRILHRTLGEQVELELHLDPALPLVVADVGGVEQVLLNLAVNARDAMPDGGRLSITTSAANIDESYASVHAGASTGPHVLVEVSDTGAGMTSEVSAQIFEPFFTTKPAGVGTGMGLATVYGIVSRWKGHISVYSEVDLGTTFKIWLPVMASATRPAHPPAPALPPESGAGRTILLVEDEPAVRRAARRILESAGYRVTEAVNGAEAVATFAKAIPDLVVTDVVMPGGVSGRALAEQLRSRVPGLPVLFMSGYTADIITARGVLEANVLLIQKPFSAEVLLDAVRRALAGETALPSSPRPTVPPH